MRAPSKEELHPVDAWWTVLFIDPVAIRLVRLVHPWRWVTPMRLTTLAHLLGLVTGALFAGGYLVAAAVLYEVRFVFDCMDGKLARRRDTTSTLGGYFDFVGDYVITGVNFAGLGLWLHWDGVAAPLAFAPALVFLGSMCLRLSSKTLGEIPRLKDVIPGPYVAWMAKRRLMAAPGRIDIEHAYLFVVPVSATILDAEWILTSTTVAVTLYFGYIGLRHLQGGLSLARTIDRGAAQPDRKD